MEVPSSGDLPVRPSPSASPIQPLPPSLPSLLGGPDGHDNLFGDSIGRSLSRPDLGTPLRLSDRPRRRRGTIEKVDNKPPEVQHEYCFDQLPQRIDNKKDFPLVGLGIGGDFDEDEDYDPEGV